MPKGYKTLSIDEEAWNYAQVLFNQQSTRNISFSRWVSEHLSTSVIRELYLDYIKDNFVVIDKSKWGLLIADKESKEFIEVDISQTDKKTNSEDKEFGYGFYCRKCKTSKCEHVYFAITTEQGIQRLMERSTDFKDHLKKLFNENKIEMEKI